MLFQVSERVDMHLRDGEPNLGVYVISPFEHQECTLQPLTWGDDRVSVFRVERLTSSSQFRLSFSKFIP